MLIRLTDWHELILYRPLDKQKPVEITWTEDDDEEKQRYYREDEPMRREVIGLVRKVYKAGSNND